MEKDEEKSYDITNYYGSISHLLGETLKKINGKERMLCPRR